jgi:D-alanyl-D-alanine carboxypeptidase
MILVRIMRSTAIFLCGVAISLLLLSAYLWHKTGTGFPRLDPASVAVYLVSPQTMASTTLEYGELPLIAESDFFTTTEEKFIKGKLSFVAADLAKKELVVYREGVEALRVPIQATGKPGSWWETPAGLYAIQTKELSHYSTFGDVYQPWSMAFQGNFFIHGWPHYQDGTPVAGSYSGGCIRLTDEDSKQVYELTHVGMPVLVYAQKATEDSFTYERGTVAVSATSYIVADIETGTMLSSKNIDERHPQGGLAHIMTALVAADHINLSRNLASFPPQDISLDTDSRFQATTTASAYAFLYPLLIEGSEVSALTLAQTLGEKRFVNLMNAKGSALGLHDTLFVDPTGESNDNVSTAHDLFRLSKHLYENKRFILNISSQKPVPFAYPQHEFSDLITQNGVAGEAGVVGGVTRYVPAATTTSVALYVVRASARHATRHLAIVVLNAMDANQDVRTLLAHVVRQFDLAI